MTRQCRTCGLLLWSGLALHLLLASCARNARPLGDDPRFRGASPFTAPDLEAACAQLVGEPLRDRARLELLEGREGDPLALDSGWLLQVRRQLPAADGLRRRDKAFLLRMEAAGPHKGTRLLAQADSLHLVARSGQGKSERLLLQERQSGVGGMDVRRVVEVDMEGSSRVVAEAEAHRLRVREDRVFLALSEAENFVEGPGSWHVEESRQLVKDGPGWKLGKARPEDSPYRALVEFLQDARRGAWGKAAQRCDLRRLLALPDGTHGRNLKASLKAGFPELLDERLLVKAPPRGGIHYLQDVQGRLGWRVELEAQSGADGAQRWLLVKLERVVAAH